MDQNFSGYTNHGRRLTTEEVIASIKASQRKAAPDAMGTDYFESCFASKGITPAETIQETETGATTLNVNMQADQPDKGATALKYKDIIKNFKAVAPTAQPTTAPSGDDDITPRTKPLAPAADEPISKAVRVSLRSSDGENEVKDACGADSIPEDDTDLTSEGVQIDSDDGLFDPDFYKARIDLFDNSAKPSATRFTAKLAIQIYPEDDPNRPYELYANFYARHRDFKGFLQKHDLNDKWYTTLTEIFDETRKLDVDFKMKPVIGSLKERTKNGTFWEYEILEHTAAIMYQAQNSDPVVIIFYQLWQQTVVLDAAFNKQMSNAPFKRGYYVDPNRAALVAPAKSKGVKRVSKADFRR